MSDALPSTPQSPLADTLQNQHGRGWLSRRRLAMALIFAVVLAAVPKGVAIYRQHAVLAMLENRGAVLTIECGPDWLRSWMSVEWMKRMQNFEEAYSVSVEGASLPFGDAELQMLTALSDLQGLSLDDAQITDAGCGMLSKFARLTSLSLRGTRIGDEGLRHVASLQFLQVLILSETQISDAGLVHLENQASIEWLFLDRTRVTDAGLKHLAEMPGLNGLNLSDTAITDAGLQHLAGAKGLRKLLLQGTRVTPEGVSQLKRRLPKCEIGFP